MRVVFLLSIFLLLSCEEEKDLFDDRLITAENTGGFAFEFEDSLYVLMWVKLKNDNIDPIWNASLYCGFLTGQDTIGQKHVYFGGLDGGLEWTEKYTKIIMPVEGMEFRIFDIDFIRKK